MDELLDVHLGTHEPTEWDAIEKRQSTWPEDSPRRRRRPLIATEQIPWDELGLMPRWVGHDTSRAVAAINASVYSGEGAGELARFLRGARRRNELATFVWTIGELGGEPSVMNVFGGGASVRFPHIDSFSVAGSRIRLSERPCLPDGTGRYPALLTGVPSELAGADRDLALRIANRPLDLPWWSLQLSLTEAQRQGPQQRQPDPSGFFGTWTPLLETSAGEVVAGVWTDHEEGDEDRPVARHYVLPALPSFEPVLQWLAERAIPELIPTAARRVRRYVADQPDLQTSDERTLRLGRETLEREYHQEYASLTEQLTKARARANQVRDPLLFGTANVLQDAVAQVLTDAGMTVTPLDPLVGTRSADLLVALGGRRVLLEVKSSSGNAPEKFVEAVQRHLRTWPELKPDVAVDGAALVVNQQHRQPPGDRTQWVYERREFVDSLEFPVISTVQLFEWWRTRQFDAIRTALGYSNPREGDEQGTITREDDGAPLAARAPWWRPWRR